MIDELKRLKERATGMGLDGDDLYTCASIFSRLRGDPGPDGIVRASATLLAALDKDAPAFRCPDATFKECFENRHDTERCAILPLFAVGDCIMGKLCVDEGYEIVLVCRDKVVR